MRPLGSLAVSLATVLGLVGLVGIPFVPHELRRHEPSPICIVQHHPLASGVSLDVIRTKEPGLRGQFIWEVVRSEAEHHGTVRSDELPARRKVLLRSVGEALTSVLDRDRQRLIVANFSGRLLSLDWEGKQPPEPIGELRMAGVAQLEIAANRRTLIASNYFGVQAVCLATNRECWARTDLQTRRVALGERSGRLLASTDADGLLELDLETGVTLRQIARNGSSEIAFAMAPDGEWFTCVDEHCQLDRVDRASGQSLWTSDKSLALAGFAPATLAISPDSEFIVALSARDSSVLVVWDVTTGKLVRELKGHSAPITGITFADDGQLHSWGMDVSVRKWRLERNHGADRVAHGPTHAQPSNMAARRARHAQQSAAMTAIRFPTR
jgi:hypothetical protein